MHAVRACRHLLFEYGIVSILAFLFFSTSCSTTVAENLAQRPGDTLLTATLDHGGDERTYHIHLPPGFDRGKPAPLVIALHGGGGEGRKFDQAATGGTLTRAADKRGVVLVFPEAVDRHWFDGRPEVDKSAKRIDDTGFISAVIDAMAADYGIDPLRVYATGISNGGFMSVRLAIDLAEKIAAVAPVTAQMSKALEGKAPAQPIIDHDRQRHAGSPGALRRWPHPPFQIRAQPRGNSVDIRFDRAFPAVQRLQKCCAADPVARHRSARRDGGGNAEIPGLPR